MTSSKTSEAMQRWMNDREAGRDRTTRLLVLAGYGVLGFFALLFGAGSIVAIIGLGAPTSVAVENRWSAVAYLAISLAGCWYTVRRLREHLRRHGKRESRQRSVTRPRDKWMLRAVAYFALVFGVGFVLGVLRVLWLVPQVGERQAEILEAPFMLLAIFVSARLITQRFPASRRVDYLVSGGAALVLLLGVELFAVLSLRGLTIGEYFAERDPIAGGVYLLMLLVFAAMPWVLGRTHTAA